MKPKQFQGSGWLTRSRWQTVAGCCVALAVLLALGPEAICAELQDHTRDSWETYVRLTEQRIAKELDNGEKFLALDLQDTNAAPSLRERLRRGEIHIERMETRNPSGEIDVKDGLIHHWTGAAFLPEMELDRLLAWLQNYDRHQEYFPEMEQSRLISRSGDTFHYFFRLRRHKIITVVYNTDHTAICRRHDGQRASSRSVATRIAQLDNPGTDEEREKPIGDDGGYLWRLNAYWRFQQADGGVYVECESLSLSRGIPFGVGWMLRGLVNSVPRESLESTLTSLRDGIGRERQ